MKLIACSWVLFEIHERPRFKETRQIYVSEEFVQVYQWKRETSVSWNRCVCVTKCSVKLALVAKARNACRACLSEWHWNEEVSCRNAIKLDYSTIECVDGESLRLQNVGVLCNVMMTMMTEKCKSLISCSNEKSDKHHWLWMLVKYFHKHRRLSSAMKTFMLWLFQVHFTFILDL